MVPAGRTAVDRKSIANPGVIGSLRKS